MAKEKKKLVDGGLNDLEFCEETNAESMETTEPSAEELAKYDNIQAKDIEKDFDEELASANIEDIYKSYLLSIGKYPLLDSSKEYELATKAKAGDEKAKEELINSNYRLVVSMARKHEGRGVDIMDLISVGNIGLLEAADRFDPGKGCKFSTYAFPWINKEILKTINNDSRNVRIPEGTRMKINEVLKTKQNLRKEFGFEPTVEMLAKEMGMDVNKICHYLILSEGEESLNKTIDEDSSTTLMDSYYSEDAISVERNMETTLLKGDMDTAVKYLNDNERIIAVLRFGLDLDLLDYEESAQLRNNSAYKEGEEHSCTEIAKILGMTVVKVQQIEKHVFMKLKPQLRSWKDE